MILIWAPLIYCNPAILYVHLILIKLKLIQVDGILFSIDIWKIWLKKH